MIIIAIIGMVISKPIMVMACIQEKILFHIHRIVI